MSTRKTALSFAPDGTAPNADANRQSLFSTYFFSAANLLDGVDDSPRIVNGPGNGTSLLGPGTTLGLDVGVGNNGEVYIRGRTGAIGNEGATAATARGLTPGMLLLIGVGIFLLARR